MPRTRRKERNGPGLLFILVTLVVVAVVGARFFGFYPDSQETEPPPAPRIGESGEGEMPPAEDREPRVLIIHSHATENYQPNESHQRGGEAGDIVQVGAELATALEEKGVGFVHDQTTHDRPRYSEAFLNSAEKIRDILAENPSIEMVLDIHRDGLQDKPDRFTTVEINGQDAAKILFVVGDQDNTQLDANIAFAKRISDRLEAKYAGLTRGVRVFQSEYSGQLHPNSVMVVIGDYRGNSIEEAKYSARLLADVVAELLDE